MSPQAGLDLWLGGVWFLRKFVAGASAWVGGVKSSWEGGELAIGLGDGTILQVALFLRCVSKHTNFLLH